MGMDEALAELREKVRAARQSEGSAKQAAWQRIQAEAPDHADLLRAIGATFGKPASVRVRIRGERVL